MADRLVVMHDGRVQQIGRPEDLYERPANPFVAGFIGGSNILAGRLQDDRLMLPDGGTIALTRPLPAAGRQRSRCGRRAFALRRPAAPRASKARSSCAPISARRSSMWCGSTPRPYVVVRGPGVGPDAAPPRSRRARGAGLGCRRGTPVRCRGRPLPNDRSHQKRQKERQEWTKLTVSRRAVAGRRRRARRPGDHPSRGAAERCVVGTWGGDYARLLRENIDDPILKPAGVEVVQDIGDESPRFAKLSAQRMLPRGTHGHRLLRRAERLPRRRRPGWWRSWMPPRRRT